MHEMLIYTSAYYVLDNRVYHLTWATVLYHILDKSKFTPGQNKSRQRRMIVELGGVVTLLTLGFWGTRVDLGDFYTLITNK